MTPVRTAAPVAALLAAGLALAACTSSGSGDNPTTGGTSGSGGSHTASITITAADGCQSDASSFAAGGLTFKVQNKDATAVSEVELLSGERILGEKENIPAGLGGEFAVNVEAGKYTLYCPGAPTERSTITVTGEAAPVDDSLAALLKTATTEYKTYVDTQIGYLVSTAEKFDTALHGSSLAEAQKQYMLARPYYEKIEPVAESFVVGKQNLDSEIDARINDVSKGDWSGFHLIERSLFADKTLTGMGTWGDQLVANCKTLQAKAKTLTYGAPDLANGAQELLDEVATSKIKGEEERYSHIDLLDMANNVEGSEQAFADLEPALNKIDASLADTISGAFAALNDALDTYRTTSNPSGYALFTSLSDTDTQTLAAALTAVQEPLSKVASKVANA